MCPSPERMEPVQTPNMAASAAFQCLLLGSLFTMVLQPICSWKSLSVSSNSEREDRPHHGRQHGDREGDRTGPGKER